MVVGVWSMAGALRQLLHMTGFIVLPADGTCEVMLGDILQLVSGSNKIPAAGLPTTLSLCFTDERCFLEHQRLM